MSFASDFFVAWKLFDQKLLDPLKKPFKFPAISVNITDFLCTALGIVTHSTNLIYVTIDCLLPI